MVGLFIHRTLNQISLLFCSLEAAKYTNQEFQINEKYYKNHVILVEQHHHKGVYKQFKNFESKNKTVRHMVQWLGHSEL